MNVDIDLSNVILKTERLILRPWTMSDLKDFNEYASVPGVGEAAGWPHHKDMDESRRILTKFIEEKKTVCLEYNGKAIGSLGVEKYGEVLKDLAPYKARELGFVLSKDYWGQGLMTEAVKRVIDYLFNELDLDVIVCAHYIENERSARVQEKCGFKHYKLGSNDDGTKLWISLIVKDKEKENIFFK